MTAAVFLHVPQALQTTSPCPTHHHPLSSQQHHQWHAHAQHHQMPIQGRDHVHIGCVYIWVYGQWVCEWDCKIGKTCKLCVFYTQTMLTLYTPQCTYLEQLVAHDFPCTYLKCSRFTSVSRRFQHLNVCVLCFVCGRVYGHVPPFPYTQPPTCPSASLHVKWTVTMSPSMATNAGASVWVEGILGYMYVGTCCRVQGCMNRQRWQQH